MWNSLVAVVLTIENHLSTRNAALCGHINILKNISFLFQHRWAEIQIFTLTQIVSIEAFELLTFFWWPIFLNHPVHSTVNSYSYNLLQLVFGSTLYSYSYSYKQFSTVRSTVTVTICYKQRSTVHYTVKSCHK